MIRIEANTLEEAYSKACGRTNLFCDADNF